MGVYEKPDEVLDLITLRSLRQSYNLLILAFLKVDASATNVWKCEYVC